MRIGYSSDLDGDMLTARVHVAVKTAMPMETRQARERERYQRQTAFTAYESYVWKEFLYYTLILMIVYYIDARVY